METTGLVAMTQTALISPRPMAAKRSTALSPGPWATVFEPQKRDTRSMASGVKSMWAANMLASPPTSRPPMALGWPVTEKGPMPGLPMRPVARWQLMALTLSLPAAD